MNIPAAPTSRRGPGFAVLYHWKLPPGSEDSFVDAWSRVTKLKSVAAGPVDPVASKQMRAAVAQELPEVVLAAERWSADALGFVRVPELKCWAGNVVDHDVAWSLYFADSDGNPFEITSYEYDAVAAALQ